MSATDPLRAALERIAALDALAKPDFPDFWKVSQATQIARDVLAAVPAEPEAWEWRAVVEGHRRTPYRSAVQDERSARDFAADLARDIPHGVVTVERRRAPGKWERVDLEPCPNCRVRAAMVFPPGSYPGDPDCPVCGGTHQVPCEGGDPEPRDQRTP